MQHHSFVIRICRDGRGRWHGKVIYVGTQQTRLFVHLDAMTEFINKHLNSPVLELVELPDHLEYKLNELESDCISPDDERA